MTAYSLKAVDASRAYVGGEGLWSKAEKEAVLSLLLYADTGDEARFQSYLEEINVTLGDRQARLELEKRSPDMETVRAGFVQGRNHPDDVKNMAWLFRTFRHEAHIDKAIAIWAMADENITALMLLADELRAERTLPTPDPSRVQELVGMILDTDVVLTELEHDFSATLGAGARFVNIAVLSVTVVLTVVFVGSALLVSATVARQITRSLDRVKAGAERMGRGDLGVRIDDEGRDEVATVAHVFNDMSEKLANAIQEREERASVVRESEARFRSLTEASLEGLLIHDGQRVLDTNPAVAVTFGYDVTEMKGLPILDLVAPESREDVLRHVRAQSPEAYQVIGLRKDGSSVDLEAMGREFPWQGRVARVVALRDLTPWKKLEQERREAHARVQELAHLQDINRFKTQFINTAAHELRTPLMPLRTQLHLMLNDPAHPPAPPQKKALDVMKRNLERLSILVEDLLTVARSQASRLGIEPQPIDLTQLLKETEDSFRAVAKDRGIEFVWRPAAPALIVADPKRISQVLSNLLSNAFKFTRKGGRVRVELEDEGMNIRVKVTDTGIGITKPDLLRLFQPFVQVHDTTQLTEPGSGLGLYICKQFVELHGGAIGVESPGRAKGSTFWFTLPKAAAPQAPSGKERDWSHNPMTKPYEPSRKESAPHDV